MQNNKIIGIIYTINIVRTVVIIFAAIFTRFRPLYTPVFFRWLLFRWSLKFCWSRSRASGLCQQNYWQKRIQHDLNKSYRLEFDAVKARQVQILNRPKDQKVTHKFPSHTSEGNNISWVPLGSQYWTRSRFCNNHQMDNILDIIARIEEISLNIPQAQACELKCKVRQILEKIKLSKSNITKPERLAIKTLTEEWRHHTTSCQRQCNCNGGQDKIYRKTGRHH